MSEHEEIKQAIEQAATAVGFRLATEEETKELLSSIPSMEQLELNRIERSEKNNRILLSEGAEETTAILDALWKEADRQTPETLPAFIQKLSESYEHDYGTTCHAMAMAAVGAAWAFDKSDAGGITGAQAGAVMWRFIHHWMSSKSPMKLVKFHDMLYPQYEGEFTDRILSKYVWQDLQEQAKRLLAENTYAAPRVRDHWRDIVAGNVPFGYTVEE